MYASIQELAENLGIAECLHSDPQTYTGVAADGNLVHFTHSSGARRAIVLRQASLATNEFAMLIPHNTLLYGKIYSLLKKKGMIFKQKLVEGSGHSLDYKTAGLLKPF